MGLTRLHLQPRPPSVGWPGFVAPLLVLTDRRQARCLGLVATVAAAVEGGARVVLLREKDLDRRSRSALARALRDVLAPVGGTLLVAGGDVDLARDSGAGGVHLAAAEPRPPDTAELVVGRSCHDVHELGAAAAEGVDYASVSPVFATASKPGYGPALGTAGLAGLAAGTEVPLVALGGITAATASDCLGAGAAAVAVMGAVMASADPAATVRGLLAGLACPALPGERH